MLRATSTCSPVALPPGVVRPPSSLPSSPLIAKRPRSHRGRRSHEARSHRLTAWLQREEQAFTDILSFNIAAGSGEAPVLAYKFENLL